MPNGNGGFAPKSEIRMPKFEQEQTQLSEPERQRWSLSHGLRPSLALRLGTRDPAGFGFRISCFAFVSDFVIRISDFGQSPLAARSRPNPVPFPLLRRSGRHGPVA